MDIIELANVVKTARETQKVEYNELIEFKIQPEFLYIHISCRHKDIKETATIVSSCSLDLLDKEYIEYRIRYMRYSIYKEIEDKLAK